MQYIKHRFNLYCHDRYDRYDLYGHYIMTIINVVSPMAIMAIMPLPKKMISGFYSQKTGLKKDL